MAYRYPTVKIAGKTTLKHRHLAGQKIGRTVSPDEHVHHKDEDPWNFADENLVVVPAAEHRRHHANERLIYPRQKACEWCGEIFTPHPTKRKRQKTCSAPCRAALTSKTEKATKARLKAGL